MDKKLLIVSDLDGTLLGGELLNHDIYSISDFNKKAIKAVTDAGHVFCIATGRSWGEAKKIYKSAEIDTIMINSNGSYIHNPTDDNFEPINSPLGKDLTNEILKLDWMKKNVNTFVAPGHDNVVYYNVDGDLMKKMKYNNLNEIFTDELSVSEEVVSIILAIDVNADLDEMAKIMEKYSDRVTLNNWGIVYKDKSQFIRINSNRTKEFGVKKLSEHYGVPQENVITFGDQMNDLTMTKWAGKGIVMGNANEELKKHADEVLEKTNNDDGVGHKLMEILKGNI